MTGAAGRRIVLVEDDDHIRALVETILRDAGYVVASTGDATQAPKLIRDEDPDLVLSDIGMPVMDGYGLLRALQADPSTSRYPVVFLTGQREFTQRVKAFRYGVVDYLTKPFTRDVLLKKIERVLSSLAQRSGLVEREGQAGTLLEEVQKEARTGVLTVKGADGDTSVMIRAGEVVGQTAPMAADASGRAEFQEVDPTHVEIVHRESASVQAEAAEPSFDALPAMLRNVVVADDSPQFRGFLRDVLARHGFTVHEAGNGEEALRVALEARPWLILCDVKMPVADGFELCRRVRNHSLLRQTPLVFLSGWDDYKERYRGLELGADDYLSKETPVREILFRIYMILKRYADLATRGMKASGMEGQVAVVGSPGILQACHLSRLTGVLTAEDGPRRLVIRFRGGEIVAAEAASGTGTTAVYEFLAWERGRFEFAPGDPEDGDPLGESFSQLVLEGCRRLDEERRQAMGDEPTSS